jgi:hypothetical protein
MVSKMKVLKNRLPQEVRFVLADGNVVTIPPATEAHNEEGKIVAAPGLLVVEDAVGGELSSLWDSRGESSKAELRDAQEALVKLQGGQDVSEAQLEEAEMRAQAAELEFFTLSLINDGAVIVEDVV